MVRKTLWIHIGHFKTGTTALQSFFVSNKRRLAKNGLIYCKASQYHNKHSVLAFSLYRKAGVTQLMHGFDSDTPPKEHWQAIFNELMSSRSSAALISSEEFMRLAAHPKTEQLLASIIKPWRDKIDFKIVAYLRPPNSHLRSWYNQLIKMKEPVPDFNTTVTSVMEPVHYDYALAMAPWRQIFGDEAIRVRTYREEFKSSAALFHDFLNAIEIPADNDLSGWTLPQADPNPRLADYPLKFTRIANRSGASDGNRAWLIKRIETALDSYPDFDKQAFDAICDRSRNGIALLDTELGCGLDKQLMLQDTPQPDTEGISEMEMALEIALREITVLRQKQNATIEELTKRVDALDKLAKKRRWL